ncbi:MAG: hypothetical protein ABI578_07770 [Chloroflexota bacterium]
MSDQRRGGAGERGAPAPAPGYRGALAPRTDSLAKPWMLLVVVIFVLIFALGYAKVPSAIFPSPSPSPTPSASVAPSGSGGASGSAAPSASGAGTATPSATVVVTPSPTP